MSEESREKFATGLRGVIVGAALTAMAFLVHDIVQSLDNISNNLDSISENVKGMHEDVDAMNETIEEITEMLEKPEEPQGPGGIMFQIPETSSPRQIIPDEYGESEA